MPVRSTAVKLALTVALVLLLVVPGAAAQSSVEPVDVALDHLRQQAPSAGLSADDVAHLRVTDAYRSQHNDITHVYVRQQRDGLDVIGTEATVNVAADGEIVHVGGRLLPDLAARITGRRVLSAVDAVRAGALALDMGRVRGLRVLAGGQGPDRKTLLSDGGIATGPIPAQLVYQAVDSGDVRLAWHFEVELPSAEHWWQASVDAETGALLAHYDLVVHDTKEANAAAIARHDHGHTTGSRASDGRATTLAAGTDGARYNVFAWPLESPNDGPRSIVTDPADMLASPYGWHDVDGAPGHDFTTTEGNNVHAYTDTDNTNMALPTSDADGGPTLNFDFPLDEDLPPPVWADAAVTNLFYWNNIIHDVFYRYGFDEPAGNFQVNNYGRGGKGNDSVRAEAQDGSGALNANFATPADGNRPRMQMYMWVPTNTAYIRNDPTAVHVRDGDLDAGIITHEYGHGISNRLTGGPELVNCLRNREQMGEGWSDWLAIALTAREGDTGEQPRGMGTYALYEPNRESKGIRPTPYSTSRRHNRATYDTIKSSAVPHGVGYVWATMLWDMYWALVDVHGFNQDVYGDWTTGGNNLAIQLVMDGMKMQPCSPGFVDGRDAILAADRALTGGENACTVWRAFANRGLGLSARQGDSNSETDGTQAFDLPASCT
ncbi:MAG TPA: M36 family metallopeptidase [Egibacteraceae bacterium]|nr:M36 family metallopeptidase [Egibacteraceae bacterium]